MFDNLDPEIDLEDEDWGDEDIYDEPEHGGEG
jgi:hypothetical protein